MNSEQVKDGIRWVVSTFGGFIAGWFASKGILTTDQILSILNSPTLISLLAAGIMAVWGIVTRSDKNIVASANAVPAVQAVITTSTPEGKALAEAVPAATVVPAGTTQAANLAGK